MVRSATEAMPQQQPERAKEPRDPKPLTPGTDETAKKRAQAFVTDMSDSFIGAFLLGDGVRLLQPCAGQVCPEGPSKNESAIVVSHRRAIFGRCSSSKSSTYGKYACGFDDSAPAKSDPPLRPKSPIYFWTGPDADRSTVCGSLEQKASQSPSTCVDASEQGFTKVLPRGKHSVSKDAIARHVDRKKPEPVQISSSPFAPLFDDERCANTAAGPGGSAAAPDGAVACSCAADRVQANGQNVPEAPSDLVAALSTLGTIFAVQEHVSPEEAAAMDLVPSDQHKVNDLFKQDGIMIAEQLSKGLESEDVYGHFFKDHKKKVDVAQLVPRKLPVYDNTVGALSKLTSIKPVHLTLAEKLIKGTKTIAGTSLALTGTLTHEQKHVLNVLGLSGSLLGATVISNAIINKAKQPALTSLPSDRSEPDTVGERARKVGEKVWNNVTIPAVLVFDGTVIASSFVSAAPLASVASIVLPASVGVTGAKLLIDASRDTIRLAQAQQSPQDKLKVLLSNPAIGATVGGLLVTGGVVALAGCPAGYLAIGSGATLAGLNLLVRMAIQRIRASGEKAGNGADTKWNDLLQGDDKLSVDALGASDHFKSLFDEGVIVPEKLKLQLKYYGISPEAKIISKPQLDFIDAEIRNHHEAVGKVTDKDDADAITTEFRYEIADCVVAAAILDRAKALEADGSPEAIHERNGLIEKRFYNNLQRGGIVDLAIKEGLLIEAIKNVYADMKTVDRRSLAQSDVKINELFSPLAELEHQGARRINPNFENADPVLLADFNIAVKKKYIQLKRDLIRECVVHNKPLIAKPIMTAEQILEQVNAGNIIL